jgi:crossover junction endodeoxyribonuclease RuvC
MTKAIRIIGLDPGLRNTGWGIVDSISNRLCHVAHGVIHSSAKDDLADRLCQLNQGLLQIIELYNPHEAAVEETFVNKNPSSTLKLGMARGVVLLAPAQAGLTVGEYAATRVKKSIVGVGHADKNQVAMMVQRLLPNSGGVTADAADALAVAICHAHYREKNAYPLS